MSVKVLKHTWIFSRPTSGTQATRWSHKNEPVAQDDNINERYLDAMLSETFHGKTALKSIFKGEHALMHS